MRRPLPVRSVKIRFRIKSSIFMKLLSKAPQTACAPRKNPDDLPHSAVFEHATEDGWNASAHSEMVRNPPWLDTVGSYEDPRSVRQDRTKTISVFDDAPRKCLNLCVLVAFLDPTLDGADLQTADLARIKPHPRDVMGLHMVVVEGV